MECLSTDEARGFVVVLGLRANMLLIGFCLIVPKLFWDAASISRRLGPCRNNPRIASYPAVRSTRARALHMLIIPVINKTLGRRVGEERDLVAGVGGVERSAPLPSLNASNGPPGLLGDSSSDELGVQGI